MSDSDLLTAATIQQFIEKVNENYHLTLPTEFPEETPLGKIWQTPVRVTPGKEDPILYIARGDPLDFIPFNLAELSLTTQITITIEKG